MKFNVGDKVIIRNSDSIWNNRIGNVVADEEDYILVKLNLNDHNIIQEFDKDNVELYVINESLEKDNSKDYIYDYVYLVDLDDNEIPSWFFLNKIATAENLDPDVVLNDAIKRKYKIYNIKNGSTERLIIVAPKCNLDDIYEEYINYLPGNTSILEIA